MISLTPTAEPVRARSKGVQAPEPRWQADIKAAIRDPQVLCERLGFPAALAQEAAAGAGQFPVFVPPAYLAKIAHGDLSDPLLRQVLPLAEEGQAVPG
ncbi:MAG: EF-P beta-lysylation protein EpmB, partial [Lacipirellulaceae bacterium]